MGLFKTIGAIGGGVAGFSLGGPWGAAAGAGLGAGLGGAIDGKPKMGAIGNNGRPVDPTFGGIADAKGNLSSQYSLRNQPRGEFEERLRTQALASGPTVSAQRAAGLAGQQAASQYAQGSSRLAQRGGLSSGARERLAMQASQQGMLGKQNAYQQGELEKQELQSSFANQENAQRTMDVQNLIQNKQNQDTFNLDRYKARLAEYGGSQLAKSQEWTAKHTGGVFGSGGMLGLGI